MIRLGTAVGSEFLFGLWPRQVELDERAMLSHKHVLGTTGSGKSKLLESIFLQSLKENRATTFIDPTGGSAEYILTYLDQRGFFNDPANYEKLIYVEFADDEYFFPMNVLKLPWATKSETAAIVIEAFMRAYPEIAEGAANFYKMMDAGIKVLLANDLPIVSMEELLAIKAYRDHLLQNVDDPHLTSFFRHNYDELIAYHRQSQSTSTLNRAYDLVASNVLRLTMGQTDNLLDVRAIMDGGKFVLVNLGRIKDHKTQRLLGAFITHAYEMGVQSRVPNSGLPSHQLILDEFGAFASKSADTLATILTRTRQYGLFLTLCHQDWSQTNPHLEGALGGCGVKISFRANPKDAALQALAFGDFDREQSKGSYPSGGPILASVQDQHEQWSTTIKTLPYRQALVRQGTSATQLIRTPDLPVLQIDRDALDLIRNEYFRLYYTHKDDINLPLDQAAQYASQRRPRIRP